MLCHMKNKGPWEMQKGFPPVEEGGYRSLFPQEQGQTRKEIPWDFFHQEFVESRQNQQYIRSRVVHSHLILQCLTFIYAETQRT